VRGDRDSTVRFYHLGAKILFLIALPVAVVATILAREMVLLLGGAAYVPGSVRSLQIMAWLMPVSWLNGITQYVLIALDQQRYLTRAYAMAFGFALAANLAALPLFGYEASAVVHVLSELVLLVPFTIGVRRHLGDIGWSDIVVKPAVAALVSGGFGIGAAWLVSPALGFVVMGVLYPVLVRRLKVLSLEERALLAPLLGRSGATKAEVTTV
jgi:O-antigen/teichoic acid export membrane protein